MWNEKNVLVTGGTGLIGQPLVEQLIHLGANVTVVSLDDPSRAPKDVNFKQIDLRNFEKAKEVCVGQDVVFQLAGIKGSPAMTKTKPASFFIPTLMFSINMMEAARLMKVKQYLFTSSVGVYAPAEIFYEDSVWSTFPSENDRFAGWAKRMGELQAEAYSIEYHWNSISIVRPANVYGPYDNFDPNNAMVIPSLIYRFVSGENPLVVWGDGSAIRDFIYADDVARGMILAVGENIQEPINLGSGSGVSIKEIAESVVKIGNKLLQKNTSIEWDTSKPSGDKKRLFSMERANGYGFYPKVSLYDGIYQTFQWYLKNQQHLKNRYNAFTEFH